MIIEEKGSDKIKKICETLKNDILDPAKLEARAILEDAKSEAQKIKEQAELDAKILIEQTEQKIKREMISFQAALSQASRQTLESLKQDITEKLFKPKLFQLVEEGSKKNDVVARLINVIIDAIDKEGLKVNLHAIVSRNISAADLKMELTPRVRENISYGSFIGGAQVRVEEDNLTVDMSDIALKELLASYLRKPEFRELIFND
jgi:V/A-type H+-transporting ATPase subunit E